MLLALLACVLGALSLRAACVRVREACREWRSWWLSLGKGLSVRDKLRRAWNGREMPGRGTLR